jgi:dihydrofolate synthase/folylpolyglutamate synthase
MSTYLFPFPLAPAYCQGYNPRAMIDTIYTNNAAYQSTLDYLYTYVDYSLVRNFRNTPGRFDLARMANLAAALGDPQKQYPILHVAGTKGKGSVSALCASALKAAGYRTGLYTSPHLVDFSERIQVNGQPIPPDEVVALVEECRPVVASIPEVTWFEFTTMLSFLYFARQDVDGAVIEVGLGGRLDATNIVMPEVAVITSLSYDHMAVLGEKLAQIATEKAGIIKPNLPVVISPQREEARSVIVRIAAERNAPLIQVGLDYMFEPLFQSLDGQEFSIWPRYKPQESTRLTIPLLGRHQIENAATAYAAMHASGLAVSEKAIEDGFAETVWPGRFEVLRRTPPVVLDCAHNCDSMHRLRQTLDEYFPEWPIVLVFGASEDKDVAGMFAELLPRVHQVIATKSIHPRAMTPEDLLKLAHPFGVPVSDTPKIEDALEEALREAGEDALVLVTGSIFVVAGVREAWMNRLTMKGS